MIEKKSYLSKPQHGLSDFFRIDTESRYNVYHQKLCYLVHSRFVCRTTNIILSWAVTTTNVGETHLMPLLFVRGILLG